jgi:hypothetical protein
METYLTGQQTSEVPRGPETPRDAVVLTQQDVHRRTFAPLWWQYCHDFLCFNSPGVKFWLQQ